MPLPNALGEAEHDVELALDVAVEAGRVQPADQVGAGVERRGDEIGRALLGRHAALREGDELNVDPVAIGLAHPQHGLEIGEADVVVDVDVAAHARRAIGDQRADECGGACFDRQRDAMALDALSGDAFAHAAVPRHGAGAARPNASCRDGCGRRRTPAGGARPQDRCARPARSALPGACSAAMRPPAISTSARSPSGRRALARIIRRGSGASPPHIDRGGRHSA